MKEYIGYFRGYCYTETPARDYGLGPGYITPVTICAAKCGRWFRKISEDIYDGFCYVCYREQFEDEEECVL